MTRPRTEARFALGTRHGPKSTVWKAWVQGDESYITSRMFGSDLKVSIHSSGECQWSCTDTWVKKQDRQRNALRHIVKWKISPPTTNQALMVFRVEIPVSEMRPTPPPTDKKKVFWIDNVPEGATVRVIFYLTIPSASDPAVGRDLPHRHLFSLRLRNKRWLIALLDLISLSAGDLATARAAVQEQLRGLGHKPSSDHRSSLFIQPSKGAPHGLLELCPTEA